MIVCNEVTEGKPLKINTKTGVIECQKLIVDSTLNNTIIDTKNGTIRADYCYIREYMEETQSSSESPIVISSPTIEKAIKLCNLKRPKADTGPTVWLSLKEPTLKYIDFGDADRTTLNIKYQEISEDNYPKGHPKWIVWQSGAPLSLDIINKISAYDIYDLWNTLYRYHGFRGFDGEYKGYIAQIILNAIVSPTKTEDDNSGGEVESFAQVLVDYPASIDYSSYIDADDDASQGKLSWYLWRCLIPQMFGLKISKYREVTYLEGSELFYSKDSDCRVSLPIPSVYIGLENNKGKATPYIEISIPTNDTRKPQIEWAWRSTYSSSLEEGKWNHVDAGTTTIKLTDAQYFDMGDGNKYTGKFKGQLLVRTHKTYDFTKGFGSIREVYSDIRSITPEGSEDIRGKNIQVGAALDTSGEVILGNLTVKKSDTLTDILIGENAR